MFDDVLVYLNFFGSGGCKVLDMSKNISSRNIILISVRELLCLSFVIGFGKWIGLL